MLNASVVISSARLGNTRYHHARTRIAPGRTGPGVARPETAGGGGRPSRRPLTEVLAARGVRPVSYVDWLRIEAAEAELAGALGRGERVKIGDREAIEALCRPPAG